MKKHLQIFIATLSLLISAACMAQPVLTATDLNPVVGDQFIGNDADYADPGSAGANQAWDVSSMTSHGATTIDVVTVSSTGYSADFPDANIAFSSPGSFRFYKTSSGAFQNYGNYSVYVTSYDNAEDILRLPVIYNDTYTDSWHSTYETSDPYYASGTDTVTVDGYGSIKTPAGTFQNVLRVHTVTHSIDSSYFNLEWHIDTVHGEEFAWYLKNNHYPVAALVSITAFVSGIPQVQQFGYYLNNPVGVKEPSQLIRSFSLSPDPAIDHINLDIDLAEKQPVEARIYNSLGSLVKTRTSFQGMQGSNHYRFDVADLSEGLYFMQLVMDDQSAASKQFIIAK